MRLPDEIREQFRRHGRQGGRRRAARMSPDGRRAVARRAAAGRWIRARFGAASFEAMGLPGGRIVDVGLADLALGRVTLESLLVDRTERISVPAEATHAPAL